MDDVSLDKTKNKSELMEDLFNEYLSNEKNKLKLSSWNSKKQLINNYIKSYFGRLPFNTAFEERNIIAWKEWLQNKDVETKRKNMAIKILKALLERAMLREVISDRTCKKALLQLEPLKCIKKKGKFDFYTYEEYTKFISNAVDRDAYTFFQTLFYTGLRRGEILGLQWQDVNLKEKTIKVHQQASFGLNQGHWCLLPYTKSTAGQRKVDLPQILLDDLSNYKKITNKENNPSFFVFGRDKPFDPKKLYVWNKKLATMANLRVIKIHDFRHSHASFCIHLGATMLYLKERLGHADIKETLNTYSHLYPEETNSMLETMNNLSSNKKALSN